MLPMPTTRRAEALGYLDKGCLRGLIQPAQMGFVTLAEGFSPAATEQML